MEANTLLSIYGARLSQDGTKVVVTLVEGKDENKKFYKACVKLDNSNKTKVKIENDKAILEIALLK